MLHYKQQNMKHRSLHLYSVKDTLVLLIPEQFGTATQSSSISEMENPITSHKQNQRSLDTPLLV
jgi:hypothetical protein